MAYSIKGKAFWANVYQFNAKDNKLQMDVSLQTQEDVNFAKSLGLKVKTAEKEGDKRGRYISLWNYQVNKDGSPKILAVVDSQTNPISETIGNESDVIVSFEPKEWTDPSNPKRKGVSARLLGVQVVNMVQYGGKNTPSFTKVEGGYVATSKPTPEVGMPTKSFGPTGIEDEVPF